MLILNTQPLHQFVKQDKHKQDDHSVQKNISFETVGSFLFFKHESLAILKQSLHWNKVNLVLFKV